MREARDGVGWAEWEIWGRGLVLGVGVGLGLHEWVGGGGGSRVGVGVVGEGIGWWVLRFGWVGVSCQRLWTRRLWLV